MEFLVLPGRNACITAELPGNVAMEDLALVSPVYFLDMECVNCSMNLCTILMFMY